jgi:HSP20 family protein
MTNKQFYIVAFVTFILSFISYSDGFLFLTKSSPQRSLKSDLDACSVFSSNWPRSCYSSVDRIFDDVLSEIQGSMLSTSSSTSKLPLDIKETPDRFEILCDIPGVQKEDVKIKVEDHILTITVERKPVVTDESVKFLKRERDEGTMSRSVKLPENSDEEKISASFENGVLKLKVLKSKVDINKTKTISIE